MSGYIVCGSWGAMQMEKGDNQLTWADSPWRVTIFKTRKAAQGAITRSNNFRKKYGYPLLQSKFYGEHFVKVFRLADQ